MGNNKKNILVIIGSAGKDSANELLVDYIAGQTTEFFNLQIIRDLKTLPHFDPELSVNNPPQVITDLRNSIAKADGVIICTPEYIFSIPSGLKNVFEWCVATTIFENKPAGLITASANGEKGHEELQLIMKTVSANFTPQTTLLIRGIKGKINKQHQLTDQQTIDDVALFVDQFRALVEN